MVVHTLHGWAQGDLSLNRPVFSPSRFSPTHNVSWSSSRTPAAQSEGGGGLGPTVDNGQ